MSRQFTKSLVVFALAAMVAACRFTPTNVPLRGTAADISALAGKWDGEYVGIESNRSGTILFEITAGSDTAHGDVLMTPQFGSRLTAQDFGTHAHEQHVSATASLRVEFVRVDGGLVRGELEPYEAPDCKCFVTTIFRGKVNGDRIEGTFVTRGPRDLQQEGRWSATRRK